MPLASAQKDVLPSDRNEANVHLLAKGLDPRGDMAIGLGPGPIGEQRGVGRELFADRPCSSACDDNAGRVGHDDGIEIAARSCRAELIVEGNKRIGATTASAVHVRSVPRWCAKGQKTGVVNERREVLPPLRFQGTCDTWG